MTLIGVLYLRYGGHIGEVGVILAWLALNRLSQFRGQDNDSESEY